MLKTTAIVKHRDYVPYIVIAIKFCDVDFSGARAKEMKKKWEEIEFERYRKLKPIYEENIVKIQELHDEVTDIHNQVKSSKPFYRFWYNKTERELLSKAKELSIQAMELEMKNAKNKSNWFLEPSECRVKIERFLKENGFALTQTSSATKHTTVYTDIWTLEE